MNTQEKKALAWKDLDNANVRLDEWIRRCIRAASKVAHYRRRIKQLRDRISVLETCIQVEKERKLRERQERKTGRSPSCPPSKPQEEDPFSPDTTPGATSSPPRNSQEGEATASGPQ